MTVPSTSRRAGPYTGNGSTTSYPFEFKVFQATDIKVVKTQDTVTTTLAYSSDYSVTLNPDQDTLPGGSITLLTGALAAGALLSIVGNVTYDQTTDLPTGGNYSALVVENTFDRIEMQIQQLVERDSRQISLPETIDPAVYNPVLPVPAADSVIGWDSTGKRLRNFSGSELASAVAFATWNVEEFNGGGSSFVLSESPGSQNNLTVTVDGLTMAPGSDFTLSGNVVTTTIATPSGTGNVVIRWGEALAYGSVDAVDANYLFRSLVTGVRRSVASKLDEWASPKDFGAIGDGIADDSAAIQAAFNACRMVNMSGGSWRIANTVSIPAYSAMDIRGALITAACGSNPLFRFDGAKEGLCINGAGGLVIGTASAFLYAEGTTNQPTSTTQYARQLRLYGLNIASTTITKFIDMQLAVRQVMIDSCYSYAANGIDANGKCVEVKIHKSIIYSSTAAAGTFGLKLRSPGGTSYYNEGWHIADCTIDNFDVSHDVNDVFVYTIAGGFNGSKSGGYVMKFGQPTSSLCVDLKFNGTTFNGKVEFAPTSGRDYGAHFSGCTTIGITSGYGINIANNAAGITVQNHKFRNGGAGTIAIRSANNNARIVCQDIDVDSTYTGGAVFIQGANGADCYVGDVAYAGVGEQIYVERPVLVKGLKVFTAVGALIRRNIHSAAIAGAKTVGSNIAALTGRFAKGETGVIHASLHCTGMDATLQRFDVNLPAGLVTPNGSGWDAKFVYPNATQARVVISIPYHVTADVEATTDNVTITNGAGNTVTIGAHSWACVEHNN